MRPLSTTSREAAIGSGGFPAPALVSLSSPRAQPGAGQIKNAPKAETDKKPLPELRPSVKMSLRN
jgi:hypothetical protein